MNDKTEPVGLERLNQEWGMGMEPAVISPVLSVCGELFLSRGLVVVPGRLYDAVCNRHGAVSAMVGGKLLGMKPDEFRVVAWRQNQS